MTDLSSDHDHCSRLVDDGCCDCTGVSSVAIRIPTLAVTTSSSGGGPTTTNNVYIKYILL